MKLNKFPFYKQLDSSDCGPTCLRMILKFHGKNISQEILREKCQTTREGVSLINISDLAESLGMRTLYLKTDIAKFSELLFPLIAYWRQRHFVVVYKIEKNAIFVADPAYGLIKYSYQEFCDGWSGLDKNDSTQGIVLLTEPTPLFETEKEELGNKKGLFYFYSYLKPYKSFLIQVILGLLFGSLIQFIFPFLTQSLVDHGIGDRDIEFIYLILFAQVSLLIGRTSVEFIRSWILLHVSTRISVNLVSDFITALMKKKLTFFDGRTVGDIMQRVGDHSRIQSFMTSSLFSVLFSIFNFIVYSIVILFYNAQIFVVFLAGSILYSIWVIAFLKKRRELDFKRFEKSSMNQNSLIQIVTGIQEIKLQNCEKLRRWEWEKVQAMLFKVNIDRLKWSQIQQGGAIFINEFKNISITIIAAKLVIDGQITFGMMLSLQYMIGMLNAPVNQFISLIQQYPDAKISMERLSDIHFNTAEDSEISFTSKGLPDLSHPGSILIKNVTFKYEGSTQQSLENIDATIPLNKVTAIVGTSGSGKTTLLKLFLKFYKISSGAISINDFDLETIEESKWRDICGAVLQDGFIFSDTIARNVALSSEVIDSVKLIEACKTANIYDYINNLPLQFQTKIGIGGKGLSQGQKQRILIARAIYKNPQLLILDEATNALDTKNESSIMSNIDSVFKGKTIIIAAHRLSTIRRANQILVLDQGKLVETGSHWELLKNRGFYFNLVRNQLDEIES